MYAQPTAAGFYGEDAGVAAAYGTVVPFPAAAAGQEAGPGNGAMLAIPVDFWRSPGFGLLLLVALVVYFDLRVLNK